MHSIIHTKQLKPDHFMEAIARAKSIYNHLTSTNTHFTVKVDENFAFSLTSGGLKMAAKKKHAPSVLLTDGENDLIRDILGQKKYVSI